MPFEDQPRVARLRRYWVKAAAIILGCFAVFVGTLFAVNAYIEHVRDKEVAKGYQVEGDVITIYGDTPDLLPCDAGMDFELSLETLAETGSKNCDFVGWEIAVSDVITIEVPPLGESAAMSKCPSGEVWGITTFEQGLGVVVYTPTQIWGDQRATALAKEAGRLESLDDVTCQNE